MDNYTKAGDKVLIISNHTSFLDPVLLGSFLPDKVTFAVNTFQAQKWYIRLSRLLVTLFPMDPGNPLSLKSLIKLLNKNEKAVIFPEGRITVTGSLMKIYQGPGLIADKSAAMVLPIRIEGAQFTPFSRLRGMVRIRLFPKIKIFILPPRRIEIDPKIVREARREAAGRRLADIMTEMMFETGNYDEKIFNVLLDARSTHGGNHFILEDMQRSPITYNQLITKSFIISRALAKKTHSQPYVGVLMPNVTDSVVIYLGMHLYGSIPALLNYTLSSQEIQSACEIANIRTICTSKRLVTTAKLEMCVSVLKKKLTIVYIEDLLNDIGVYDKVKGFISCKFARQIYKKTSVNIKPIDPAFLLFTSITQGPIKGVKHSHKNILASRLQLTACIDFSVQDIIFNPLPLYQSFSLTAGIFLPLLSGMKTFLYPTPVHFRIIPEVVYDTNATILLGTNTLLASYAKFAHPYDFYSVRYVFSGIEKLQDTVWQFWVEKFGVRIFDGYCPTDTSPVLSINTPMINKRGTLGRLLPKIDSILESVPGIEKCRRLYVKGPNIMSGQWSRINSGKFVSTGTEIEEDWYDTGVLVTCDEEGFISICDHATRMSLPDCASKSAGRPINGQLDAAEEVENSTNNKHFC